MLSSGTKERSLDDHQTSRLLSEIAEIRALAGLLFAQSLLIEDDRAREQTGYIARHIDRHVAACLALAASKISDGQDS